MKLPWDELLLNVACAAEQDKAVAQLLEDLDWNESTYFPTFPLPLLIQGLT